MNDIMWRPLEVVMSRARRVAALVVLVALLFVIRPMAAQDPATPPQSGEARLEAFDVVSIRRNGSGSRTMQSGMVQPGGRYTMINAPLIGPLYVAHQTESGEVLGLPGWVREERYDIDARVEHEGPIYPEDVQRMVRAMLADRLGLRVHVETRERDIYELVLADPDGPLPSALRRSEIDCDQYRRSLAERFQGSTPRAANLTANGALVCMAVPFGGYRSGGSSMADLAAFLRRDVGRIVRDRTGLDGYYEFALEYDDRPLSTAPGAEPPDRPDIFTALHAQLGLKIESRTVQVEVLVIDHIERPSPN